MEASSLETESIVLDKLLHGDSQRDHTAHRPLTRKHLGWIAQNSDRHMKAVSFVKWTHSYVKQAIK